MDLISEMKRLLEENDITYEYEEKNHRHLFRWNDVMRDAGMVADNVLLDLNIDAEHEVIFLGLIRIPRTTRGKGLGAQLVKAMKKYAREQHFAIILESAPENLLFWQKMHFSTFLYEDYGFWMMGYGGKSKQYFKVKWLQIKPHLYSDVS
ncbi:MAG TPA: GNAT family N-acetyltransferase [Bacillota bacterium]|nr:GNAT family N-acetyltransferase [Bacillota bacterium]